MDEALKQIELFNGLDEQQVEALLQLAQETHTPAGEIILREGDEARGLFVLVSGRLEVTKEIAGRSTLLDLIQPGSFVGEISLLTRLPHMATVHAEDDSVLLFFPRQLFEDSLDASPIIRVILQTMSQRLRATEAAVQQHEKLSALGKMAAGLAHELNNPAAASLRAVQQLPQALLTLQSLVFQLNELGLEGDEPEHVDTDTVDERIATATGYVARPGRSAPRAARAVRCSRRA